MDSTLDSAPIIRVPFLSSADDDEVIKRYTAQEIETLRNNGNVKEVREDRLVLTYECRLAIYEKWVKNPGRKSIRDELENRGLKFNILGTDFIKNMHRRFHKFGCPQHGKNPFRVQKTDRSADKELAASGKFEYYGNGIRFTESFAKELASKYPEQSIEDGIKAAGIDPQKVGYQRIYTLKRMLEGEGQGNRDLGRSRRNTSYNEDTVREMQNHPYVKHASSRRLVFRSRLYKEASVLQEQNCSIDKIMEIYEIPPEWMSVVRKYNLQHCCRKGRDANTEVEEDVIEMSKLNAAQQAQYLRIQAKRIKMLEEIVRQRFEMVGKRFPHLNPNERRQVCEWIRDDVPKKENGSGSLRGLLQQMSLPKSTYYGILSNDAYGEKARHKEEQEIKDAEAVRRVIDYKNYPKGSRQVYMQMERITGRHMSRRKIMYIMQKNHWQCDVKSPNMNRRAARERLKTHVKPNLLRRKFRLHRPGEVYLTDVTYMKYGRNLTHLAYGSASVDPVTGRLYSFQVSPCNNLELVIATLRELPLSQMEDAVRPMLHSDQGALYLTDEFQELVKELGMEQSMSKRGNCWDNACQESFFGHFKDECKYTAAQSMDELKQIVADYSVYYNAERCQWNRNRMTPLEYETYLNNMTEEEFQAWQAREEKRYEEMKQRAREKAIERSKTLGV